ncbi:MAG: hypothetical protein KGO49_10660 [Gammaproteobacteria bacterium]|nr:hypothetical protein [Gammaproteobacteria bacterium]
MRLVKLLIALSCLISMHSFATNHVSSKSDNTNKKSIKQLEPAKISGVITYFFNDNYGNKPDTGATVTLIKYDKNFMPNDNDSLINLSSVMERLTASGTAYFPIIKSSTVDGIGRYEITGIKPGSYYIIIKSQHTKSNAMLGLSGKIFISHIELESGQTEDISNDFGMSER